MRSSYLAKPPNQALERTANPQETHYNLPDWLHEVSKYFVAATFLIGPFVGSAVGVLVGFVAGLYFVRRRRRHAV
jgi:hypothetical protein